jgi:hypothetical protein
MNQKAAPQVDYTGHDDRADAARADFDLGWADQEDNLDNQTFLIKFKSLNGTSLIKSFW